MMVLLGGIIGLSAYALGAWLYFRFTGSKS